MLQESYACGPGGIFMRVTKFPPVMEKGLFRMTEPTLHTQLSHRRQADFHNIFISIAFPKFSQSYSSHSSRVATQAGRHTWLLFR